MKKGIKIGMGLMTASVLICMILPMNLAAEEIVTVKNTFTSISEMTAEVTVEMTGNNASEIRFGIDYGSGDGDGEVTASEVTDFEADMKADMEQNDESDYKLDGITGKHTDASYSVSGAVGSDDSTKTVTLDATVKIKFDSIDDKLETHTFKIPAQGDGDDSEADYTLTVPSGYKIDTVKGIISPVKSNGGRTVKGKAGADAVEITIIRLEEGNRYASSNDSPGFELLGVGMTVSICAVLLARKREK